MVDIVGVTGSIPVTPTIRIHKRVSEQSETLFRFSFSPALFPRKRFLSLLAFACDELQVTAWRDMLAINFALKNKIQCR
ncbi:hypothetical protein N5C66_16000 [Rhizobium pusense]|uniref:hypothetical protein n=1 Tax=Rhizobium/Agrobacterium group TaxID=227290 RepID=UPI00115B337C|nr:MULTISPECIES: hypothetical protein [Rhizobium/Agrobacterium group]MDH0910663.1 hypothetical protein [Agrobacterium pusense]MDH1095581.1 hypothetical protein [Agrobacterium pusense]MDH1113241.1 hypothetical protein [Agrobacterium pusense]MDH2192935.1 hypothetical protein [Agrobacterium pusense]